MNFPNRNDPNIKFTLLLTPNQVELLSKMDWSYWESSTEQGKQNETDIDTIKRKVRNLMGGVKSWKTRTQTNDREG